MTNTYVPFSYYKITKLQNYKQKIQEEKIFAMEEEDPAPSEFYRYNQSKVSSPKSSGTRHVTITLDRTSHQARPFLLVTRLVIEAGGSLTQSIKSCHFRDPCIVVRWGVGFEIERTERNFPFTDT